MNRTTNYAHELGVRQLFKYRSYRSPEDKRRVWDIVKNDRLYFGTPSQMDDELEGKPIVYFRRFGDEAATRSVLLQDARRVWKMQIPPPSVEDIARWEARLATAPLREIEIEGVGKTRMRLERMRLCSFSVDRDRPILWHEYAANGCGVSLHFDSGSNSPFGLAQMVTYSPFRPEMAVPFFPLGSRAVFERALLQKTVRWINQTEYRMIVWPRDEYDVPLELLGLSHDGNGLAHFPPRILTGITLGLALSLSEAQELELLAQCHNPPLTVARSEVQVEKCKGGFT